MCGIAGAVDLDGDRAVAAVDAMCGQMIARGPDDGGVVSRHDGGRTFVLGNRRLAIIDPSPAGHQPMSDDARGNAVVFNGMIYNYRELRDELIAEGERFHAGCDTEVVLRAYGRWGEDCVQRLRGMFAFAVHDQVHGRVFLARDRVGIKPLYYWHQGGRLLFASQVKALLATGAIAPSLSREAVRSYLAAGSVSEPLTAIDGILALPAGHTATFTDGVLAMRRYWRLPVRGGRDLAERDAADELRRRLDGVVQQHLVSDAPLGVFLSGGLDSSLVAAIASKHRDDLRTISIGFEEASHSEAEHAQRIAAHIGSRHTQVDLRAGDLRASLPAIFDAMDQPTFDGINTWAVSRAAADAGLKVALSGLGADELFDGYGHARRTEVLRFAQRVPSTPRRLAASVIERWQPGARGDKAAAFLRGEFATPLQALRALFPPDPVRRLAGSGPAAPARAQHDLDGYTRDTLLRDTDAMSMAHSLEVRVPYLDHELVEWAMSLSPRSVGRRKQVLRAAARGIVPEEIIDRRKQGFVLPLDNWMRGQLRGDIEAALREPPRALAQLMDAAETRLVWQRFLRDGRDSLRAWSLYALAQWSASIEAEPARAQVAA